MIHQPPNLARQIDAIDARITELSNLVRRGKPDAHVSGELVFSFFGTPTTAQSGPARARTGAATLSLLSVLLGTAGTTATVVTVYKNGAAQSPTVAVAASATRGQAVLAVPVTASDVITVACTTVGAGALSPTVYVGY